MAGLSQDKFLSASYRSEHETTHHRAYLSGSLVLQGEEERKISASALTAFAPLLPVP